MAEEDEGAIGADWAMGAEGAVGAEGVEGAEEDKGAAIYILLDGLGHHGNRLYCFMRLGSKMLTGVDGWMEWSGYPLDCYDY